MTARQTDYPTGFDVTCVIGRVEIDPSGNTDSYHAAFKLIADASMSQTPEGPLTYRFPGTAVTVDHTNKGF